jgi:hypothetical protein
MLRRMAAVFAGSSVCMGLLMTTGGVTAAAATATSAASATSAARCPGIVRIRAFAFTPPHVLPGQPSAATLTVKNCTAISQPVTETWYGHFSSSAPGIPAGCPVLDPFLRPVALAAGAQQSTTTTYQTFPSCTATQLAITVTIAGQNGTVLAQQTADLQIG